MASGDLPADELYREFIAAVAETNVQVKRAQQIQQQAAGISVEHRSANGAVRVTVDGCGALTDLVFTDAARRISPNHLSGLVLDCIRAAKIRIGTRFEQIVRDSGADDATVIRMMGGYRAKHPDHFGADGPAMPAAPAYQPPPYQPPLPAPAPMQPAAPRRQQPVDEDFSEGIRIMERGYRRTR